MLNHIEIMGRFTRDIELRRTGNGNAVASFTIAVDRDYSAGSEKETDFIDCVAWKNTAEYINRNFGKGKLVVISGKLQTRTWKDKDGNNRKSIEIIVENCYPCEKKKDDENGFLSPDRNGTGFEPLTDDDDDLPF